MMKCLPHRKEWVSAFRNGDVKAGVENTKFSEGHGLKGVPRHGTIGGLGPEWAETENGSETYE